MILTDRVRRSQKLNAEDLKKFIKWVNAQETKADAAEIIGIRRATLDRIMLASSGSPRVINIILEILNAKP